MDKTLRPAIKQPKCPNLVTESQLKLIAKLDDRDCVEYAKTLTIGDASALITALLNDRKNK